MRRKMSIMKEFEVILVVEALMRLMIKNSFLITFLMRLIITFKLLILKGERIILMSGGKENLDGRGMEHTHEWGKNFRGEKNGN